MLKKTSNILIILVLFLSQSFIWAQKIEAASNVFALSHALDQEHMADEIIVKYHRNPNFLSSLLNKTAEEEQNFFAKLDINYHVWNEASEDQQMDLLRKKIRKFRKQGKIKKLKKAKKLKRVMKEAYAVIKLDHEYNDDELSTLIKRMNLDKYNSDNFAVDAVYPNYKYEITRTNDPQNSQQYSHEIVKPEALWNITRGEGAVIAVIDTGVDIRHEDLEANIWTNPGEIADNGIDDDKNGFIDDVHGWDFVGRANPDCSFNEDCSGEDNDPSDINGHGTHVAGIAAAVGNNNIGISGIAPDAKIMPIRAGYSTGSSAFLLTDDIIQSINYAIDNNADVINMSFAGYGLDVLSSVLNQASKKGIVCVAAAGNNSSDKAIYPAAISSVISVGATADGVSKAFFSNYGQWVDITAPGSWIYSTVPNNGYDNKSGTSMAAPIVAGIAALLKAKNKNSSPSSIKNTMLANATDTTFYVVRGGTEYIGGIRAEMQFAFEVVNAQIPDSAVLGEPVSFSASASESVSEFEWISNIDGVLSNQASFNASNLSLGTHSISVRAKNASGQWTPSQSQTLIVQEKQVIITPDNNNESPKNSNENQLVTELRIKIKKRSKYFYAGMSRKARKQISGFRWTSNIDGVVANKRWFHKRKLSNGAHILSLEIKDAQGQWLKAPFQRVAYKLN